MEQAQETQAPGYEMMLKALLLHAAPSSSPTVRRKTPAPSWEDEHTAKLKLVLEYIGEHYPEELTIPQLARLCFFSEYHFMRFFKKYTGVSCLEYIKNLRLEKKPPRA